MLNAAICYLYLYALTFHTYRYNTYRVTITSTSRSRGGGGGGGEQEDDIKHKQDAIRWQVFEVINHRLQVVTRSFMFKAKRGETTQVQVVTRRRTHTNTKSVYVHSTVCLQAATGHTHTHQKKTTKTIIHMPNNKINWNRELLCSCVGQSHTHKQTHKHKHTYINHARQDSTRYKIQSVTVTVSV